MKFKKVIKIRWFLCVIAIVLVCGMLFSEGIHKHILKQRISRDQATLNALVEQIIEEGGVSESITYHGYEIQYYRKNSMVEFLVSARGLVPSTTYSGFYYSPTDQPMGFQGTEIDFEQDGDGWRWEEETGDNWEYTEQICDNWYWFQMHF